MEQSTTQSPNNRLLVVSGGGSRGAWGAGYAKYLTQQNGQPYEVAFGTSTGSLMIPLIITGNFDLLQKGYTSVTQKSIFEKSPFKKNGQLNGWNVLWRCLLGKKTLGETQNLRKLIKTFLNEDIYQQIRDKNNRLDFGVMVVNLRNARRCVKYASETESLADMQDWMWASSNQPLLMTYYGGKKGKDFYVDGGVYDTIPIMPALKYAEANDHIDTIDVIINQPKKPILNVNHQPTTLFKGLTRLIELWRTEVADDDILIGLLSSNIALEAVASKTGQSLAEQPVLSINLHYFPTALYPDNVFDLQFEKMRMNELWEKGAQGEVEHETHGKPRQIKVHKDQVRGLLNTMNNRYEA